jgi:hypothetical protein
MPARVTDQTQWCLSTPGLRWAGEDSVDLIGNSGQRPSPACDRRGRELEGSATGPGSFSWLAAESRHNLGMNRIWSLRPQGTSAKNWSPDLIGAAVISFEWIAQGFTAVSFWTVPWSRIAGITGLEDRLRRQGHGPSALAGPTESE